jgi:hypothetical protein
VLSQSENGNTADACPNHGSKKPQPNENAQIKMKVSKVAYQGPAVHKSMLSQREDVLERHTLAQRIGQPVRLAPEESVLAQSKL